MKRFSQSFQIHSKDDHTAHNIDQGHQGHDLFRNSGNPVDSSQEDHGGDHGNYDPHYVRFYSESGVKRTSDRVRLYHISHKSQSQDDGYREKNGKELSEFPFKKVLYIVNRSAYDGSVFFFPGKLSHNCFSIDSSHPKESADPHPEDGSRASGCDSGSCSCNIPGTYLGGDGRSQRLERTQAPFRTLAVKRKVPEHPLHSLFKFSYLNKLQVNGIKDSCSQEQHQQSSIP